MVEKKVGRKQPVLESYIDNEDEIYPTSHEPFSHLKHISVLTSAEDP